MVTPFIRKEERKINNILFSLCLFITIISVGMMLLGFFTKGEFPPTRIGTFYVVVLLIYSLHKEALRWIEKEGDIEQQKKGEVFVYIWIIVTTFLYLINFLTRDYFLINGSMRALSEITFTTIEVCGVFIFTRLLKVGTLYFIYGRRKKLRSKKKVNKFIV